jgi:Flp pilus assembly protein TadD
MNARRIITIFMTFTLVICATALWGAEGNQNDGDTDTNVVAASGAEAGTSAEEPKKKKGSRFARMFKAPFKAVGKLFGGGDDSGKVARMSERDADRFESVGVMRVEDKTTERPENAAKAAEPSTAREYLERGRELLAENRLNEAIAALSTAVSLDPKLARAHSLLAVAYDRKGLHERARESYQRAVGADESDAQALNNLGYSLYLNGNYRAAVERLKRAAKLAPGDARVLNNLALAQFHLGKYDDAYKSFARAGGEFNGHANVAALLIRTGRDERAAEHLEAARRIDPTSSNVLRQLADLYRRTGRQDRAEEARKALEAEDAKQQFAVAGGR